jgi:hypothetical protein
MERLPEKSRTSESRAARIERRERLVPVKE